MTRFFAVVQFVSSSTTRQKGPTNVKLTVPHRTLVTVSPIFNKELSSDLVRKLSANSPAVTLTNVPRIVLLSSELGLTHMTNPYFDVAFTNAVKAEQVPQQSRSAYPNAEARDRGNGELGSNEIAFIEARDGLYLATVND